MFRKCVSQLAFRRVGATSAAVAAAPVAVPSSSFPIANTLSSTLSSSVSLRCYGPGESRRLTFEERSDKRSGKNRQNREERQSLMLEAEKIATIEFMEELDAEFNKIYTKAQQTALKITNMQRCLETIEIDAGGRKIPILQTCQIVKVSPLELHVIPTQAAFTSPILQRLMRFDSTIAAQKENNKIKLTLQRITTQRRDKAAADIKAASTDFNNKLKTVRQRFARLLGGVGAGDDAVQQLLTVMDGAMKDFAELKTAEFEELIATVTSTGIDESDESIAN